MKASRSKPDVDSDKPIRRKFETYAFGYFHINLAEVRTAEGQLHPRVANYVCRANSDSDAPRVTRTSAN